MSMRNDFMESPRFLPCQFVGNKLPLLTDENTQDNLH